jgi:hypothetical protein
LSTGLSGPGLLLIVLGLVLGPGYLWYHEHLSGETLQSVTVTDRADRWTLPDGTIHRFRSGLAYRPVVLALDPELNRLRLTLTLDFPAERASAPVEYLATLLDQDYPIIEQPVSVRPVGRVETAIRTFEVRAPGSYLFLLEEVGGPRPAANVTVHLRGRIEKAGRALMWTGYGLLLLGLGLLVHSLAVRVIRRGSLR